jgi:hypothetical protein
VRAVERADPHEEGWGAVGTWESQHRGWSLGLPMIAAKLGPARQACPPTDRL